MKSFIISILVVFAIALIFGVVISILIILTVRLVECDEYTFRTLLDVVELGVWYGILVAITINAVNFVNKYNKKREADLVNKHNKKK